ncbi:MAG: murein biosynthesis integral membrane protein MurJ [Eubacterium sp.]|nr:murein biosynthesis integral membrane protein MurJ [Eubacterium sp.]
MSETRSKTESGVLKATGILVITNMLSSLLGYVREVVMTTVFDLGDQMDAYLAAFTIPDLIYTILVGGGLSAAFIPVFGGYLAKHQEEDGYKMASTVFNLVAIVAAFLCILGEIFTPQLMNIVVESSKWSPETLQLTYTLTRIMFFQGFFMCIAGICMGILQSYKDFAPPSIGAVLYNIAIIGVGVLLLSFGTGIAGFSIGVVVGAIIEVMVMLFPIYKHGFKYKKIIDFDHEGVRQFFKLFGPVLIGIAVTQINLVVNSRFASGAAQGMLSTVKLAQRIMQLPINIFALSIALSIFPTMVEHVGKKDMESYKSDISMATRTVTFIILPCAVGLIAVRIPFVRAVYFQGSFSAENVPILANVLGFYCIGMIGYSVRQIMLQGFYAIEETRTPVRINIFILCLNMVLTVIFSKLWGGNGIAIAYSVAGLCSVAVQTFFLKRKVGHINGREIKDSVVKCAISCAVMFVVTTAAMIIFEHHIPIDTKKFQILELFVLVALGGATYFVMALLLKMSELTSVIERFKQKFTGR